MLKVIIMASYRYLSHTTDKAMMERKTRYEVQELFVAEYNGDGGMKFITGEDLNFGIVTKSKERYVPRNWNLMKRYKKLYKVRGEI